MPRPFHLALPTADLERARAFYTAVLGCGVGRSASHWVDLDFFGHQLVLHDAGGATLPSFSNPVDAHSVPVPHLGVVLEPAEFAALAAKLDGKVEWVIPPTVRFEGTVGEQQTMFFRDTDGNALEFKSFADDRYLFEPFSEEG